MFFYNQQMHPVFGELCICERAYSGLSKPGDIRGMFCRANPCDAPRASPREGATDDEAHQASDDCSPGSGLDGFPLRNAIERPDQRRRDCQCRLHRERQCRRLRHHQRPGLRTRNADDRGAHGELPCLHHCPQHCGQQHVQPERGCSADRTGSDRCGHIRGRVHPRSGRTTAGFARRPTAIVQRADDDNNNLADDDDHDGGTDDDHDGGTDIDDGSAYNGSSDDDVQATDGTPATGGTPGSSSSGCGSHPELHWLTKHGSNTSVDYPGHREVDPRPSRTTISTSRSPATLL